VFQKILLASKKIFGSLSVVRTTVSSRPDAHLSSVPSVRTTCIFRPDPSLYREASVLACIRPDVSAARPDAFQYLTKLQTLSNFIYGKITATIQTRFSLRQESQFKYNRPDVCQHGPDTRAFDMEIAYSTSTIRTSAYHGPDAR
jgi:hypothetical protein